MKTRQLAKLRVRAAAVETMEARRLMSVTIPNGYIEAGSFSVSSTSSASASSSFPLDDDAMWFVKASGTHTLAPGRLADSGAYQRSSDKAWVAGTHLHVDGVSGWGAYQSDNVYGADLGQGDGQTLSAYISDSKYSDNSGSLTVTLYKKELPTVRVEATDADGSEDNRDTVTFTFTRSGGGPTSPGGGTPSDDLSGDMTVSYTIGGDATAGLDYTGLPAAGAGGTYTITIPDGQASAELVLTPENDSGEEDVEDVTAAVAAPAGGAAPYAFAAAAPANADIKSLKVRLKPPETDPLAGTPLDNDAQAAIGGLITNAGSADPDVRAQAATALTASFQENPAGIAYAKSIVADPGESPNARAIVNEAAADATAELRPFIVTVEGDAEKTVLKIQPDANGTIPPRANFVRVTLLGAGPAEVLELEVPFGGGYAPLGEAVEPLKIKPLKSGTAKYRISLDFEFHPEAGPVEILETSARQSFIELVVSPKD